MRSVQYVEFNALNFELYHAFGVWAWFTCGPGPRLGKEVEMSVYKGKVGFLWLDSVCVCVCVVCCRRFSLYIKRTDLAL